MKPAAFVLRPRSGAWNAHPAAHDPGYRLLQFDMTVDRNGRPLGGHNVQVVVGAPDQERHRLDRDVALWLKSGWWVTLRNQFAQAPEVAVEILGSAAEELSGITAHLTTARGEQTEALTRELFASDFLATGPDYWR
jgi:hypothetical protein